MDPRALLRPDKPFVAPQGFCGCKNNSIELTGRSIPRLRLDLCKNPAWSRARFRHSTFTKIYDCFTESLRHTISYNPTMRVCFKACAMGKRAPRYAPFEPQVGLCLLGAFNHEVHICLAFFEPCFVVFIGNELDE